MCESFFATLECELIDRRPGFGGNDRANDHPIEGDGTRPGAPWRSARIALCSTTRCRSRNGAPDRRKQRNPLATSQSKNSVAARVGAAGVRVPDLRGRIRRTDRRRAGLGNKGGNMSAGDRREPLHVVILFLV
jgi:hypothetical protein